MLKIGMYRVEIVKGALGMKRQDPSDSLLRDLVCGNPQQLSTSQTPM